MITQHESTFTIDGVDIEVEWEMDGSIPVWNVVGDDICHGPNLSEAQRDKLSAAIHDYMTNYYSEYY